ncbi:MAG: TIGR03546 family protein, partial [Sediminispirochaetaceae bacterium]
MITLIAKFLAALNANSRPGEAAAGFACGILLALIPADNLLWILLFTVFFFLRLHLATMILTTVVFKLFIGAADPLIDALGLWILQLPRLEPLFTQAINTPVLPFLKFNNTLVMGGCAAGIL